MAQHPQLQPEHQQHLTHSDHHDRQKQKLQQTNIDQSNHPKPTNNNRINCNSTQQQQLERDSKRTLIKNQLHLIEQLQLENVNLRNERDQLQLENEELKFHLQMISSSNILHQSGSTFNDQHLERLVENDKKINRTYQHDLSVSSRTELFATPILNNPLINQVKLSATPLEQPIKSTCDMLYLQQQSSTSLNHKPSQPVVRKSCDGQQSGEANPISQAVHTTLPPLSDNKKPIGGKSTPLMAFSTKTSFTPAVKSRNLTHDDEEQQVKLVEQQYGDDSEQVQAAAIIIQRAFRKYQICKRFRTITEQLRHTYHSSINQPERKRASPNGQIAQSSNPSSNGNAAPSEVPYASGITRAAAWQSLSYAASRLTAATTASTLGATAIKKQQPLPEEVAKQQISSQRQVTTSATSSTTTIQVPAKLQPTPAHLLESNINSCDSKQQNSVVAAAINFQQLESMRKRQYRVGLNIFNKNPEKGVSFLVAHSFIDSSSPFIKATNGYYHSNQLHFIDKQHLIQPQISPNNNQICQLCCDEENLKRNVAHFLLHRKGLAKEKIGQYLGNLQEQFNQDVLKYYLQELDFYGIQIDLALRKFLSTFRLPGEAQKIEKIVDCFAQRYVQCQLQQSSINLANVNISDTQINNQAPQLQQQLLLQQTQEPRNHIIPQQQSSATTLNYKNNLILLTKDEIFILTFAIIMLNTDLHSPSLKPTFRMSSSQFINNLRGVFKSQTINENDLIEIYERVKANQITTTPDHVSHVMKVQQGLTMNNFQRKELPNLCVPHRRLVCFCRLFEVYDANKKEKPGQHQREIFLFNDLLLVTKLARRVRANSTQLYTFRQSILLQGLYVQLFQTTYYPFGIRLCQRSNDETLIMFNARNELDQSRFVDDLGESIAEMDEMETIKAHDIIDAIHFKYLKKLRRHAMMHNANENIHPSNHSSDENDYNQIKEVCDKDVTLSVRQSSEVTKQDDSISAVMPPLDSNRHAPNQSKFSSMLNLSSVIKFETKADAGAGNLQTQPRGLRMNLSFAQPHRVIDGDGRNNEQATSTHRRCSTSSVHSLDSGLFLSRDVSPNQSS